MLATLLLPDAGRARVADFDVVRQADEVRYRIGLGGQHPAVDEIQQVTRATRLTTSAGKARHSAEGTISVIRIDHIRVPERVRLDAAASLARVFSKDNLTQAAVFSRPEFARRGLLCCGAAAGPLFVSMFLIEGARRPDYNPLRHPVSSLSLGPRGWVQAANFAITGMLYLAGAAGLARSPGQASCGRIAAAALGATGLGLLGSAAFRTDPVNGYPPGTPDTPTETTATGAKHTLAALPIFLGIPAAALACAWRFYRSGRPGWAAYSAATSASMLTTMGLFSAGLSQAPRLVNHAGLFQRAAIVTGFSWLTALSVRAPLSNSRRP